MAGKGSKGLLATYLFNLDYDGRIPIDPDNGFIQEPQTWKLC